MMSCSAEVLQLNKVWRIQRWDKLQAVFAVKRMSPSNSEPTVQRHTDDTSVSADQ
jgi:hypothetical protein